MFINETHDHIRDGLKRDHRSREVPFLSEEPTKHVKHATTFLSKPAAVTSKCFLSSSFCGRPKGVVIVSEALSFLNTSVPRNGFLSVLFSVRICVYHKAPLRCRPISYKLSAFVHCAHCFLKLTYLTCHFR